MDYEQNISTSTFNKIKDWIASSTKNKIIICVCIFAILFIIVFLIIFASNNETEKIKNALNNSSFMENGVINKAYSSEDKYQFENFSITSSKETTSSAMLNNGKSKEVTFNATIKNESFKTEFSATSEVVIVGDAYDVSSPKILTSSTTPLKGVSKIGTAQELKAGQVQAEAENFSSSLDSNNNEFTSNATCKIKYDFWFADDTADVNRNFRFDNEKGWVATNSINMQNQNTNWKISNSTYVFDQESEDNSRQLDIKNIGNGKVNADYKISFSATAPVGGLQNITHEALNEQGQLEGTTEHEFGKNAFKLLMKSNDNKISKWNCEFPVGFKLNNNQSNQSDAMYCYVESETLVYKTTTFGIFVQTSNTSYYHDSFSLVKKQ